MSSDDISLLKQMRDSGEITDEQYDVLRRHVLWGTPLPDLLDDAADTGPDDGDARAEPTEPPPQPEPEPPPAPPEAAAPEPRRFTPTLPRIAPPQRRTVRPAPHPAPQPGPPPPQRPSRHAAPQAPRSPARKLAGPALGTVVVLAVAAAGVWFFAFRHPSAPSATGYARSVCSDIAPWKHNIENSAQGLATTISGAQRGSAQSSTASYYQQQAERTDHLGTVLGGVGTPRVAGSERYVARLAAAVRTAAGRFRNLEQQVRELDPDGRSTFDTALTVLTRDPQSPVGLVTAQLGGGKAPPRLARAFGDVSSCTTVLP